MTRNEKIARAQAACNCDPVFGIAMCCCLVALPKFNFKIFGIERCPVKLPEAFICPRHEIMEW